MKVFLMSIVGQTLIMLYLLYKVNQTSLKKTKWGKVIMALLILMYLFFLGVYIARKSIPWESFGQIMYFLNNYYVIILIYSFIIALIGLGTRIALLLFRKRWNVSAENKQRWYGYMMLLSLLLLILACNKGYRNTMEPIVSRYEVKIAKPSPGQEKLRIALVTDPHIGEIMGLSSIERLAKMVEAEKPDIFLIGGDIFDYDLRYGEKEGVKETLKSINSKYGTYIVMGNHEYRGDVEGKKAWLRDAGTLLIDSLITLPGTDIQLLGRDDHNNPDGRASFSDLAMRYRIDRNKPLLLLDHQPRQIDEAQSLGIDLAMFGHTHGGQFVPFRFLVQLAFKQIEGISRYGNTTVVVSSGYGVAGSPFRVGTRSELVIIDVEFQK